MKNELVSAIIITHDRFDYLLTAIESVRKQTYDNIEIIVVDDASGIDRTEYFSAQTDIQYIYIPKADSKGGNHARNVGVLKAQGKYVAFLDDDDEWLESKIEKQVSCISTNPEVGVVGCGRITVYDSGEVSFANVQNLLEGDLSLLIFARIPYTTSTLLINREKLINAGLFDVNLRYWQEYELEIRLAQITMFGVIKENLILYRAFKSDKMRLTNKLAGWMDAVKYINKKHEALIKKLPKTLYKERQLMIAMDGVTRAISVSDKKSYRDFRRIIYRYNPSLKNYVKYIIGLDGINTYNKLKPDIKNLNFLAKLK